MTSRPRPHARVARLGLAVVVATALTALATPGQALSPALSADPAGASARTAEEASTSRLVLDEGHIDLFEVTYDAAAQRFVLQLKDDTRTYTDLDAPSQYRDPDDVVVQLPEEASRLEVTEDIPQSYRDLLGPVGSVVYYTAEVQMPGVPWPGWSSERLTDQLRAAGITLADSRFESYRGTEALELDLQITGPGDVFTWTDGPEAPQDLFIDTRTPEPDVVPVPVGSHVHTSWAFTRPGSYTFVVTPRAEKVGGGEITAPPTTYHLQVGGPAVRNVTAPSLVQADSQVRVGSTLTARPGTWDPSDALVVTRWLLDGDVVHAGPTFTVPETRFPGGPSLAGATLEVETIARREGASATRVRTRHEILPRATTPSRATPTISVNRLTGTVRRGGTASFRITVKATSVTPTGTVRVVVGGTSRTVRLSRGVATARLELSRWAATGTRPVTVSYSGDRAVAPRSTRTTIKVVR